MPIDPTLEVQLKSLGEELDRRTSKMALLRPYDEGGCPIPDAIHRGNLTRAYRALMATSDAPWGSLIVDAVLDRLDPSNILDSKNPAAGDAAWDFWQDNSMDDEAKLAHRSILVDGRANALVWNDPDTNEPMVSLDDCTQMVVQYQEGSRRKRTAALRRWMDAGGNTYATLYRPDGIYKFSKAKGELARWQERRVDGESWPLRNPLEVVPVVELRVNPKLSAGPYPYARGEFEAYTGLIDRINLLTFFGLVVALWMGFPLRGVIGEEILKDDNNNVIPPFDSRPDSVFQFENPESKIAEFKAADRKNLSVFEEFEQLASISKTPKHYFPMAGGISNIAEPTIRAFEGGLHAKVTGHKSSLGEGWEEVSRLGLASGGGPQLSSRAQMDWKDHESRSLGERADAFVKLTSNQAMPPLMAAEIALNLSADEIARWQATQMGSVFDELLRENVEPSVEVDTVPESSNSTNQVPA